MEIVIAGGHGKIGMQLGELLADRGERVRSLIRKPEQSEEIERIGAQPVICDLESAPPEELTEAISGADAVVFAAGAGAGSGPERKRTVDFGGAVKLIAAARAADIRRYVMVSSMGADAKHQGDEVFDVYLRAKGLADAELAASGLAYTIVRPGQLTDDPPTGRIQVGESVERGKIPRADVAAVLAACLRSDLVISRAFEVVSGEVPIAEAVGVG